MLSPRLKKVLRGLEFNHQQIESSTAVIAVLANTEMYNATHEQGFMPRDVKDTMIQHTVNLYKHVPKEVVKNIVHFDAGLISMQIMLLVNERRYNTVTMGGFE